MGTARPIQLFDDEPHVPILHIERYEHLEHHLEPFRAIVTTFDAIPTLLCHLHRSNRSFVVIAILPEHTSVAFTNFSRTNFEGFLTITGIYSLYKEYQLYVTNKSDRFRQTLTESRSTTDNILKEVLFICFGTFKKNIDYCKKRAQESHSNGDNGIAALYEEQSLHRCRLLLRAIDKLEEFI